jgi:site-specific DNA recombinase
LHLSRYGSSDRLAFLRLAETLTAFLQRLHASAQSLDVIERQRVVRLLLKEILVDDDYYDPSLNPDDANPPPRLSHLPNPGESYLLRSGRGVTAPGKSVSALCAAAPLTERIKK